MPTDNGTTDDMTTTKDTPAGSELVLPLVASSAPAAEGGPSAPGEGTAAESVDGSGLGPRASDQPVADDAVGPSTPPPGPAASRAQSPDVGTLHKPDDAEILFRGGYGTVCIVPGRPGQVLKVPYPFSSHKRAHEVEKRIFRRLRPHRNLVKLVGIDEYGIYLERAPHCLQIYFHEGGEATPAERMIWSRDLALVLHHVHRHGVRHADIRGSNLLLAEDRTILLCDFAGSSIDDEDALIVGRGGYIHPNDKESWPPTIRGEIHSLGSTIYEIVTSQVLFKGIEEHIVKQMLTEGKYPDVSHLILGNVIAGCWQGRFHSADEVAQEITDEIARSVVRLLVEGRVGPR